MGCILPGNPLLKTRTFNNIFWGIEEKIFNTSYNEKGGVTG